MAIVERKPLVVDASIAIIEKRAEEKLDHPIAEFEELVTELVLNNPNKKMENGMWRVIIEEGSKTIHLQVPPETGKIIHLPTMYSGASMEEADELFSSEVSEAAESVIEFPLDMIDDPPSDRDRSISVTVVDSNKGKIIHKDLRNVFPITENTIVENSTVHLPTYTFILSPKHALLYREEITQQSANLPHFSQENIVRLRPNNDNELTVQQRALQRYTEVMGILTDKKKPGDDGAPAPNNVRTFSRKG